MRRGAAGVRRGAGEVQERCRRGQERRRRRGAGEVQERSGEVQERCRRGAGGVQERRRRGAMQAQHVTTSDSFIFPQS